MASRLPAVIASVSAALLAIAIVLGIMLPTGDDSQRLHGVWSGTIQEPGEAPRPVELSLPGSFQSQGYHPNSVAVVRRTVVTTESALPWILHLASVRHAIGATWDGEAVASFGEPERERSDQRLEGAALIVIPRTPPGPHEVELTLRGDLHRGGLSGQIRLAPVDHLLGQLQREAGARMGFALAFALVGCLHLLGASMRSSRWNELLFGGFVLSLAGYAFEHSTAGLVWGTDPRLHHLARRVFVGSMLWFAVAFVTRFVLGRLGRPNWLLGGALASTVLLALTGPRWGIVSETIQDAMVPLVITPWVFVLLANGTRRRVPGAPWLLAAMAIAAVGAIDETLVTQGIIPGVRWMYPALCAFLLLGSLAVARQDRALSDRHRRLVTHTEDAMIEVDRHGRVRQLNPAASAFLPGLAPGRIFMATVPPPRSTAGHGPPVPRGRGPHAV